MSATSLDLSVIIPAYNESERIAETVRAALAIPGVLEAIVVDDGSSDDTSARAREAGATRVIRSEANEGKGAAMNRGFRAAKGETLLFLDGDLGSSAREGEKLLAPLISGEADVTLAIFPSAGKRGGFGAALRLSRWGIRRLTGVSVTAPLSGQRAMKREVAERIGGFSSGYSAETGMTVDLLRAGYRLVEVPVEMSHKAMGRNIAGFRHRGRQMLHIAAILLMKALRRR